MRDLSRYETVNVWLSTTTNSTTTRVKYSGRFGKFLDHTGINPDELVQEWKQVKYKYPKNEMFMDKYTDIVQNYYAMLCGKNNLAPITPNSSVTPIMSFFNFHRIHIKIRKQKNVYIKYHNRDLKKDEIKRILEHSSIREKAFYLIMAESGLRPRTIVQLKYKHIKEDFESDRIPMKIDVPAEIVKDRVGNRFTFIGQDGHNALKEYLSIRDRLGYDDYLFVKERNTGTESHPSPETFANTFSKTVLKLQLTQRTEKGKPKPLRLYCLRKYFRNNIRVQDTAFRKFWMGRSFGTDEYYITRDVERHREEYEKAYPNLRISDKPNPKLEDLEKKVEELKRENEQLRTNDKDWKKLREEVEELKELNALLKERDFLKMLKKAREMGTIESVEE